MKIISLIIATVLVLIASMANADTRGFISIPASAFSGENSDTPHGYQGNESGTTRHFNVILFAPVNLPHRASVTSFKCGGSSAVDTRTVFRLRRNEPQQQNVEIANVKTSLEDAGFEFMSTNIIRNEKIDNEKYNYYIVAEVLRSGITPPTRGWCSDNPKRTECSVNSCSIGYTIKVIDDVTPEKLFLSEQIKILQERLFKKHNGDKWPIGGIKQPDEFIVELTPKECDELGGKIAYHIWCGHPYLSCTTTDKDGLTRGACIDELDPK